MDVYGFLTRSVRDSALLMDVASTEVPERPFSESVSEAPAGLRIAVSTRSPFPSLLDRQVRRALDDTVELLRGLGHFTEPSEISYGMSGNATTVRYLRGIHDDAVAMPRASRLSRRTRGFSRMGSVFGDSVLERAKRQEAKNAETINRVFADHDVVLLPLTAKPPVRAARWEGLSAARTLVEMSAVYPYCATWNQIGQPACAVPAGITDDGLPLSVQLIGRPDDEATLLRPGRSDRGRAPVGGPPPAGRIASPAVREIRLHDTLSGSVKALEPREPGGWASTPAARPSTGACTSATRGRSWSSRCSSASSSTRGTR